jgi:hypothetical protein
MTSLSGARSLRATNAAPVRAFRAKGGERAESNSVTSRAGENSASWSIGVTGEVKAGPYTVSIGSESPRIGMEPGLTVNADGTGLGVNVGPVSLSGDTLAVSGMVPVSGFVGVAGELSLAPNSTSLSAGPAFGVPDFNASAQVQVTAPYGYQNPIDWLADQFYPVLGPLADPNSVTDPLADGNYGPFPAPGASDVSSPEPDVNSGEPQ